MRYCPESHYIFSTFASAFLLKLLRPKFSSFLEVQQHHEILDLVKRLSATLNRVAMDDRHAPKLYSRFLLGLVKKAEKILARGSSASSASSPASTAAMNSGYSPATYPREFTPSSSANMFVGEHTSLAGPSVTFAPYPTGGNQAPFAQNQGGAQVPYTFDENPAFEMDGVQNSLPQSHWPHSSVNTGDGDTLMHMQLFGDQFWEEGLLPGFSWSGSTTNHHGDNVVRDYSNIVPPEIQVSYEDPSGYASAVPQANQQPYFQSNPVQAFPTTGQQHQQNPYSYQSNTVS